MRKIFGLIVTVLLVGIIIFFGYLASTRILTVTRYSSDVEWKVPMGGLKAYLTNRYLVQNQPIWSDAGDETHPKKLVLYFTDKQRMMCPKYGIEGKIQMGMTIINVENISTAVYLWVDEKALLHEDAQSKIADYLVGCLQLAEIAPLSREVGPKLISPYLSFLVNINPPRR